MAGPTTREAAVPRSADVVLPDLDLPGVPHVVTSWFASEGQNVVEGDRLVEITAGDVTIELAATLTGLLVERCVYLDNRLVSGQLIARLKEL